MASAGSTGVNAAAADRSFGVQNLTMQQQDVQRARQNFDATLGANAGQERLEAGRMLANQNGNQEAERQAAEDRLRQMLLSEEFSSENVGPTDSFGHLLRRR